VQKIFAAFSSFGYGNKPKVAGSLLPITLRSLLFIPACRQNRKTQPADLMGRLLSISGGSSVAFSPDGTEMVVGGDAAIQVIFNCDE